MNKLVFYLGGLLGLVFGVFLILFVYYYYFAPLDKQASTIEFNIESGQTLNAVAVKLQKQKLIRSSLVLRIYHRLVQKKSLQAGIHQLSASQPLVKIYDELHRPAKEITITILPGWRREEIAEYLSKQALPAFSPEIFLQLTVNLEGKLMPDTYKVAPLSTSEKIVSILQEQFELAISRDTKLQNCLKTQTKSLTEILIIASLLQREARDSEQMRMIAGIINNRLAINQPLQLCATAQYASGKDSKTGSWWLPPSLLDTKINSVYNTYVHTGLPPTPIAAVSLGALQAACDPQPNDYYYYLHDSQGIIHYGKTGEDHQKNISQFLR